MKPILSLFFTLLPTATARAVDGPFETTDIGQLPVSTGQETATELAVKILNFFLQLTGVVAVIMLIFYGIMIVTSGGDEQKVELGKKGIIWAVFGLLVIILSLYLIRATQNAVTPGGTV